MKRQMVSCDLLHGIADERVVEKWEGGQCVERGFGNLLVAVEQG
jgi:hypothetical protein